MLEIICLGSTILSINAGIGGIKSEFINSALVDRVTAVNFVQHNISLDRKLFTQGRLYISDYRRENDDRYDRHQEDEQDRYDRHQEGDENQSDYRREVNEIKEREQTESQSEDGEDRSDRYEESSENDDRYDRHQEDEQDRSDRYEESSEDQDRYDRQEEEDARNNPLEYLFKNW